ncbi:MAG TPA: bacillithiol biosynthesis BshC, partial [Terriglobales bacterium]|nr:bacillithiol biosynthesis BshC [Terriglobales bacterium]
DDLNQQLLARDQELEAAGYHAQVKVVNSSTLLFYVKDNRRLALHRKNGHFSANGEQWSPEQLRDLVEDHPERFSGNALLRPVVQDSLLPTAAYVGGPAEIAYFAQSQVLYQGILGRTTPIWPRFSATLIEARLASWMRKYGLRLRDILQPKQKLLTALAGRTMPANLKEDFDRSRELLERMFSLLLPSLQKLDPTVASAAEVAARKMQYQMEKLETGAARSQLDREQVIGRHGATLSALLFPESQLQERAIPGIYFLCKHGPELLGQLIETYRPECQDHQAIGIA